MNYIIKLSILLSVLLFSSTLKAQSAEECLDIADNYLRIGEYKSAVHMYRRVLYFDATMAEQSYGQIGECYMALKQYDAARYYYLLGEQGASNDSIKSEMFFRKIASYIIEGKYLFARTEMLSFQTNDRVFEKKAHFYNGIISYHLGELADAESHFMAIFPQDEHQRLMDYISSGEKIARKKPYLALGMSAVLPGLGQAYAGEWEDAANSFFINALTTTLYFYVIASYSYLDAVLAVLPWWHRYYVGGFTNARDMVKDKRKTKMDLVLNDILLLYTTSNSKN